MKTKNILLITMIALASCNQNTQQTPATDSTGKLANIVPDDKVIAGPVPNTIMTEAYVKNLAISIYTWGWPMANIHNRFLIFNQLKEPMYGGGVLPLSPPSQICMLTDYVRPEERAVACPNQDVVYGMGSMDFRKDKEPIVIQVPDFGDRFWVYQICDQRTDGFAAVGKMYDTKPGFYLLVDPGWNGKTPDGITGVFKCPTKLGVVIPRVFQTDDPADKKAIQPLISQITMYPLSKFDGKMKTIDWTKIKSTPPDNSGSTETKWVKPETFFDELPDLINEAPPMQGEESFYAQIHALLKAIAKNPKLKVAAIQAAGEAEKNIVTPLFQFVNVGYPVKNNWTTQSNGAKFGFDYLTRLSCAKANIFVNRPNETKYFYQDLDASGVRLNGTNKYTVTFAKGETPLVKGFWSLTLYNKEHFFEPNSLNRYSLGTKNKDLQYNADGSLTLYVQNTPPSADKMNNWLPAPKEIFSLYIRGYWPEERVLSDNWNPPGVVKVK